MPASSIQKSMSTTTLVSQTNKSQASVGAVSSSGAQSLAKWGPIETRYMRRVAVRLQKQSVVMQRLGEIPMGLFLIFCVVYLFCILVAFTIQIVIMAKHTPLFYACTGFWVSFIYAICIVSIIFLERSRTPKMMYTAIYCNCLGGAASVVGLMALNIIDMALFNPSCIVGCDYHSSQYLNLIMVIFGLIGFFNCAGFLAILELSVLREARSINIYLENRK